MGEALSNQSTIRLRRFPCTGIDKRIKYYVAANDSLALSQRGLLQHSQLANDIE
jgi:hypothetical protein